MKTGKGFDLEDFRDQLQQMRNMGGISSMLDKLPGMGGLAQAAQNVDMKQFVRMEAIINSMTPRERIDPVRFISNRSSGKMGYAVAQAAREAGAAISGFRNPAAAPVGEICENSGIAPTPADEALSTDAAHGALLEAEDCDIRTLRSGYGTYADGGASVNIPWIAPS